MSKRHSVITDKTTLGTAKEAYVGATAEETVVEGRFSGERDSSRTPKDRVLIVDDEAPVREVVSRWLEAEGYPCDRAGSGEEALDQLEDGSYTLLICDITMPGMTGVELLAKVRRGWPDIAVIMITGVDDRQTAFRCLELGAYGYVMKPFDQNEVIINAANALERRRLTLFSQKYAERLEQEVQRRMGDLRRREEEVALRLVWASEYRDSETGAHIRRIGRYAELMARTLEWPPERVELVRVASLMHDIGKIGIPDSILLKPGPLIPEEFELMKKHTEIGAAILGGSRIPLLQMAEEIALCHHEWWDGSGYPRGLMGEEIPESARIVAVIDVYDSLVHDRVYRPAIPEGKAISMMEKDRGTHFEPRLFDQFMELLPELRMIRQRISENPGL